MSKAEAFEFLRGALVGSTIKGLDRYQVEELLKAVSGVKE